MHFVCTFEEKLIQIASSLMETSKFWHPKSKLYSQTTENFSTKKVHEIVQFSCNSLQNERNVKNFLSKKSESDTDFKLVNQLPKHASLYIFQWFVSKSDGQSNFSHLKGRWALKNEMVWRVFCDFLEYLRTQLIPTTTYFQCTISHPRIPNFEKFSAARVVQYFKAW